MKKFTVYIDKPEYTLDLQNSLLTTQYYHIYVKRAVIFWGYNNIKEGNAVISMGGSDITFIPGYYSFENIKTTLGAYGLQFTLNPYINQVSLYSPMSDIVLKDMAPLLGFDNPTTITNTENYASNQLNIRNGLEYINIGCNIVDTSSSLYNGKQSNVICSLPVGYVEPIIGTVETHIDMESKVGIVKGAFNQLKFTITDQDGKPVDVGKLLLECYLM